MSAGSLLFIVCGVACLVGAVVTIAAKNPIRGAVGLLATIVGMAGLFLALDAQFLAAIQLIVYAGAVVVLFVFVIMLLGPDAGAEGDSDFTDPAARFARGFSAVMVLGMLIVAVVLLATASEAPPTPFAPVPATHGTVEAVGGFLFTQGLVPFELVTILLIISVVGAIALSRGKPPRRAPSRVESPTRRLFHGPVVPRDAAGPSTSGTARAGSLGKEVAK